MYHFKLILLFSLCYFGGVTCVPVKDGGKAPRIPLNDGTSIPTLGYGTFLGFDENGQKIVKTGEIEEPVKWALESGYRLIDTAQAYKNEDQVGAAVRSSKIPREDIYVVTKKDESTYDVTDYVDIWKSMEEAKNLGLTKSIGLSNFNISQIERLQANSIVKPAVLQVEVNLNLAQNKLLEFCKAHDIVVMAYTPFGLMFSKETGLPVTKSDDPELVDLAKKYGKTVPQIVLKYLVQRGVVPIPKSVRKEKVEENIDVFDFELTSDEMKTLAKFNTDYRTLLPSFWQDHPYYPFKRIDNISPNIFKKKIN